MDAVATQAVGKALGLDDVISQLETMAGGDDAGMADVDLTYTLGEASDLWEQIFLPLKEGKETWIVTMRRGACHAGKSNPASLRCGQSMGGICMSGTAIKVSLHVYALGKKSPAKL